MQEWGLPSSRTLAVPGAEGRSIHTVRSGKDPYLLTYLSVYLSVLVLGFTPSCTPAHPHSPRFRTTPPPKPFPFLLGFLNHFPYTPNSLPSEHSTAGVIVFTFGPSPSTKSSSFPGNQVYTPHLPGTDPKVHSSGSPAPSTIWISGRSVVPTSTVARW